MEPEPAIYPAFYIQYLFLKMFTSIHLKPLHEPAMGSPIRWPQGVRLGFPIAVVERWFPGALSCKLPLRVAQGEKRREKYKRRYNFVVPVLSKGLRASSDVAE
jgi:hypothetical protein